MSTKEMAVHEIVKNKQILRKQPLTLLLKLLKIKKSVLTKNMSD